jgi:hypothetical protein
LGFFWLILAWGLVCDTWSFAVDTWAEPYSLSRPRPGGALEIPIANNSKNLRVAKLPSNEKELRRAIVLGRPDDWLDEAERAGCGTGDRMGEGLSLDRLKAVRGELTVSDVDDTRRLFDTFSRSRRIELELRYKRPDPTGAGTFLLDLTSEGDGLIFSKCYYEEFDGKCAVYGQVTNQVAGKFFLKKAEKEE